MRGGALPPALLFAAFAFALSFAPRRIFAPSLVIVCIVAIAVSFFPVSAQWRDAVFLGCWTSACLAALSVHLPGGVGRRLALAFAVNSGVWGGAVISASGVPTDLVKSLLLTLLCVPGAWLVATKRQIVIKVLAGWIVAVAVLAAGLQVTTPTPGYAPDHMD